MRQNLVFVFNRDRSAEAPATSASADADNAAAKSTITTAAADALGEDAARVETPGLDLALVIDEHFTAVAAGAATPTKTDDEASCSTTGAATAADALTDDCVRGLAMCRDYAVIQVVDIDIAATAGTAAIAAAGHKDAVANTATTAEAANAKSVETECLLAKGRNLAVAGDIDRATHGTLTTVSRCAPQPAATAALTRGAAEAEVAG